MPVAELYEAVEKARKTGILRKYLFLLCFLVGTVLLFMEHNMINIFLVRIIEGVGGSSENLGVAIAIAATLELPIMAYFCDRIPLQAFGFCGIVDKNAKEKGKFDET